VAAVVASPTIAHEPYTDAFVHARPWAAWRSLSSASRPPDRRYGSAVCLCDLLHLA
jgi:hypothetical protein